MPNPVFNNYDPEQVVLTFGNVRITGYITGSRIKAGRNTETWTTQIGSDGSVTRVRSHDRTGRIEFSLMQGSLTNDLLSALAAEDELTGLSYKPCFLHDLNGTTSLRGKNAWLVKPADSEFASEGSAREWMIDCDQLIGVTGGHIV